MKEVLLLLLVAVVAGAVVVVVIVVVVELHPSIDLLLLPLPPSSSRCVMLYGMISTMPMSM